MSAEADLLAALQAHAPLVARVGTRIWLDEVPAAVQKPYLMYAKKSPRIERGLDNSIHARIDPFDIHVCAAGRPDAIDIRLLVEDALTNANQPPVALDAGYDETNAAEIEIVSIDWWT